MQTINYRFNQAAFDNTVRQYEEDLVRHRQDIIKILLSVVYENTRPVEAKMGEHKGKVIQLITYRPLVQVGLHIIKGTFQYRVYGVGWHLLVANEWMEYAKVQEMQRLNKAFLPDGLPQPVRQFLLEGGPSGQSKFGTPRVLNWLADFYLRLSRKPGDYAMVESEKIRATAQGAGSQAGI